MAYMTSSQQKCPSQAPSTCNNRLGTGPPFWCQRRSICQEFDGHRHVRRQHSLWNCSVMGKGSRESCFSSPFRVRFLLFFPVGVSTSFQGFIGYDKKRFLKGELAACGSQKNRYMNLGQGQQKYLINPMKHFGKRIVNSM